MKAKLGISVALFAALTYLLALFTSNYIPLLVVVGYILICETDEYLRKSAVKALLICIFFALISSLIGLIPNAIGILDDLLNIFEESFSIPVISRIITFINTVLNVLEKIILLAFALLAFLGKRIKVPVVDDFLDKHM